LARTLDTAIIYNPRRLGFVAVEHRRSPYIIIFATFLQQKMAFPLGFCIFSYLFQTTFTMAQHSPLGLTASISYTFPN